MITKERAKEILNKYNKKDKQGYTERGIEELKDAFESLGYDQSDTSQIVIYLTGAKSTKIL
jgi:hypothetical protein